MTKEEIAREADRLPKSNPNCVHLWAFDVMWAKWICGRCGYAVPLYEIYARREGGNRRDSPERRAFVRR